MPAPIFNQLSGRLYALSSSAESDVPDYWAGYLCSAAAAFGALATLQQAWADRGGVFLFLAAAPADAAAFAAALIDLLPELSPRAWLRWLWLANPTAPSAYWQVQQLDALPVAADDGPWRVIRDAHFSLGSYALLIASGGTLTLATASGQEGMQIEAGALRLMAPDGVYPAQGVQGVLPLAGAGIGAFGIDISLINGTQAVDDMQRLGVMLRYGLQDPHNLAGEVHLIDMPLLRQEAAIPIAMRFAYDPLHPLAGKRSYLSFFPDGSATPPPLSCALLTNRGWPTRLAPLNAAAPLSPARLVFGRTPLYASDDETGAAFDYHLAPDGTFALTMATTAALPADTKRLMLGICGTEYAVLPAGDGCVMYFQGGHDAYVPISDDNVDLADRVLLSPLGSTAYAALLPSAAGGNGLDYYAQPLQAPLYDARNAIGEGFLDFHEMKAATLSSYRSGDSAPPPVLPIGIYSRVAPAMIGHAQWIENTALAPARRLAIGLPVSGSLRVNALPLQEDMPTAVTPQGLVAVLSNDRQSWAGVLMAHMPRSQHQQVMLTMVGPYLQAALQSNQLFFVVSNPATFMRQSSVAYQLTADNALRLMQSTGVPDDVALGVKQVLASQQPPYKSFVTEEDFDQAIGAAAGTWLPQVQNAAGQLRADIEGWNFQLSPRSWRKGDAPTLMLFKFCNRPLTELAADPASWGWKQAAMDADGSMAATVKVLNDILDAAQQRMQQLGMSEQDPYLRFYVDIASNPLWNGVLFLNAPVDFLEMPKALQFLAAGIDTKKFYAHHIGFSVTPYASDHQTIVLGQTAAFGLIDYSDPQDLLPAVPPQPFGFKTLQLRVLFANAVVADFSAQVELMVNRLFGSPLQKRDPSRGNNLVLDGSYQRVGGEPSYAFVLTGSNIYQTQQTALLSTEVVGLRLETSAAKSGDNTLAARFILSGRLRFVRMAGFDLFSFGPNEAGDIDGFISFDGLAIGMSFPLATPHLQTFSIAESALSFDNSPEAAKARHDSLAENFPLQLLQLVGSPDTAPKGLPAQGQSPMDMGFTSIGVPLEQTPLTSPWYGLVFSIDFGTLGALAGAVGLKAMLLAGWMQGTPQNETPPAFLGLKLVDTKAIGGSLPLQGVLKLGFRSFQFETYLTQQGQLAYLLRMHRLALSVLAWSFPPGNTDVLLYGAPGQPKTSLGWYAAYAKDDAPASGAPEALKRLAAGERQARRLRSGRRTPPAV